MNTERIKEIQQETAYPESISVQQALLKVWNECEQEKAVKNNAVLPHVSISVAVEEILKPKYLNDVYTWNQVRDAIIKATER
jgi:hypothetical protein